MAYIEPDLLRQVQELYSYLAGIDVYEEMQNHISRGAEFSDEGSYLACGCVRISKKFHPVISLVVLYDSLTRIVVSEDGISGNLDYIVRSVKIKEYNPAIERINLNDVNDILVYDFTGINLHFDNVTAAGIFAADIGKLKRIINAEKLLWLTVIDDGVIRILADFPNLMYIASNGKVTTPAGEEVDIIEAGLHYKRSIELMLFFLKF